MVKNSFLALLGRICALLAKALVYLLIARKLGASGQGEFSLALSASVIMSMLAGMGVDMSNSRVAGARPEVVGPLITNTLIWSMVAGGIASGINALLFPVLKANVYDGMSLQTFWLLEALIPIQVCLGGLSGIAVGLGRFQVYATGLALQHLVWLAVTLATYLNMNPSAVFAGWMAGVLVSTVYFLGQLFRGHRFMAEGALLREQVSYGSRGFVHALATTLNYRLDLFLVAVFMDSVAVGHYSMASLGAELLLYLPRAVGSMLLAQAARQGDRDGAAGMARAYRVTLLLLTAGALGGILLAPFVVPLILGNSYLPMISPLQFLLLATIPMGLATMASNQLFGAGRASSAMVGALVGLVGTIIVDAAMIPSIGLLGAAIASLVAYTLYSVSTLRSLLRLNADLTLRSLLVVSADDLTMMTSWLRARLRRRGPSTQTSL